MASASHGVVPLTSWRNSSESGGFRFLMKSSSWNSMRNPFWSSATGCFSTLSAGNSANMRSFITRASCRTSGVLLERAHRFLKMENLSTCSCQKCLSDPASPPVTALGLISSHARKTTRLVRISVARHRTYFRFGQSFINFSIRSGQLIRGGGRGCELRWIFRDRG